MASVGRIDNAQLLKMSFEQLDELFGKSPSGPIPNGHAEGTAIIAPGTAFSDEIARIINIFAWKGKEFDAEHGTLTNRLTAHRPQRHRRAGVQGAPAGSISRSASSSTTRRRRSSRSGFATRSA